MNTLLIFFALPLATIIVSIALQQILKNPGLVAAIIFSIFLVVTFIINNLNFLVATIIYTIISFITAVIVWLICKLLRRFNNMDNDNNSTDENTSTTTISDENLTYDTFNYNPRINVIPHDGYRNCKTK